jgi:hypothetical protein
MVPFVQVVPQPEAESQESKHFALTSSDEGEKSEVYYWQVASCRTQTVALPLLSI